MGLFKVEFTINIVVFIAAIIKRSRGPENHNQVEMASSDVLTSPIPFADPSWHSRADHPYFRDSHRRLQRFIREYIDSEIAPNVEEWERQSSIPEKVRAKFLI